MAYKAKNAIVRRTTNQGIVNVTSTPILFDLEVLDTGNFFNPAAPTKFTISVTGAYLVTGTAEWAAGAGTKVGVIQKNGVTQIGADENSSTVGAIDKLAETVLLTAGDYIEFFVYQNTGGSLNVTADGENAPTFAITGPL